MGLEHQKHCKCRWILSYQYHHAKLKTTIKINSFIQVRNCTNYVPKMHATHAKCYTNRLYWLCTHNYTNFDEKIHWGVGVNKESYVKKAYTKKLIPTSAKAKSRFITLKDFSSSKNLSAKMLAQYTTGADSSVFSVKHSWTLAGCRTRHTPAQPTNMCH